MKIEYTRKPGPGNVFTFSIPDHPEKPSIDLSTDDFGSGAKMREAASAWAKPYGGTF